MGFALLLFFLQPEILKDHQKYWKSDCCQDRIKKQDVADGVIKITMFKYTYFKIS